MLKRLFAICMFASCISYAGIALEFNPTNPNKINIGDGQGLMLSKINIGDGQGLAYEEINQLLPHSMIVCKCKKNDKGRKEMEESEIACGCCGGGRDRDFLPSINGLACECESVEDQDQDQDQTFCV